MYKFRSQSRSNAFTASLVQQQTCFCCVQRSVLSLVLIVMNLIPHKEVGDPEVFYLFVYLRGCVCVLIYFAFPEISNAFPNTFFVEDRG